MKILCYIGLAIGFLSCSNPKQNSERKIKEIVCGDSVDQKVYTETGEEYILRVAGKCDTIYEDVSGE